MPGRNYNAANRADYSYGFNGKLNDNDVKGVEGGQQDYGMRIYDPRMGKFLSVDPLFKSYAGWSPYIFAQNKPTRHIDIDGGEIPNENREEAAAETWREEGYESEEEWVQARQASLRRAENEELERERERDELKQKKDPIWRQWRNSVNAYARGGVEVAPSVFGGTPTTVYPRISVNKGNGNGWEKTVGEILTANPNYKDVIKQVSLTVTGTMKDGTIFTAKVRLDFAAVEQGGLTIDFYEAKYSLEEITVNNVKETFTREQMKMDKIFQTADIISFQVRGKSLESIGIKGGTDITAKVKSVNIVVPQGTTKPNVSPNENPVTKSPPTKSATAPKRKN